VGTPLCAVSIDPETKKKEIVRLGKVTSLEINHKPFEVVKRSQAAGGVAVKIEHAVYEPAKMFGRHFEQGDEIVSQISRESLDVLKSPAFKADVSKEDVQLLVRLKALLGVQ